MLVKTDRAGPLCGRLAGSDKARRSDRARDRRRRDRLPGDRARRADRRLDWRARPRRGEAAEGDRWTDAVVYAALAKHVAAGHGLTVLVGNHDLELALPDIQSALCEALKCRPGAIHFVDDGRAWRLGGALVEHGNRYDDANLNDWTSLREIAASQSRGETPLSELEPSFGSQLVHKVVQKYKQSFEFIDTLQPQGVLVAYLMAALEPGLLDHLPALLRVWRGQSRQARNADGAAPKHKTSRGAAVPTSAAPPPEALFGPEMDTSRLDLLFGLTSPTRVRRGEVSAVVREMLRPGDMALLSYLNAGTPVPRPRLELVQATLAEMTWGDRSLELDGPTGPYGRAAERLRRSTGAQVVVMGHTHQARHIGPPELAEYINTGTWADLVRVPNDVLAASDAGLVALEGWLRDLSRDRNVRVLQPSWAELRVEPSGEVTSARLERGPPVRRP
jgi:UDP-2,3-diacylglucosamine pyrophosphatase LpxH